MKTEKTPEGFKAFTESVPSITAVATEEHQAINSLKTQLREAAARGEI